MTSVSGQRRLRFGNALVLATHLDPVERVLVMRYVL